MLADSRILEILSLYEQGWEPPEIADIMRLHEATVRAALMADAEAYPDEPLRSDRVLH